MFGNPKRFPRLSCLAGSLSAGYNGDPDIVMSDPAVRRFERPLRVEERLENAPSPVRRAPVASDKDYSVFKGVRSSRVRQNRSLSLTGRSCR